MCKNKSFRWEIHTKRKDHSKFNPIVSIYDIFQVLVCILPIEIVSNTGSIGWWTRGSPVLTGTISSSMQMFTGDTFLVVMLLHTWGSVPFILSPPICFRYRYNLHDKRCKSLEHIGELNVEYLINKCIRKGVSPDNMEELYKKVHAAIQVQWSRQSQSQRNIRSSHLTNIETNHDYMDGVYVYTCFSYSLVVFIAGTTWRS